MGILNISVYGRNYQVACDNGQEDHLRDLGFEVDERVRLLARSAEGAGEHLLLLLSSLMMSDELRDVKHELNRLRSEISGMSRPPEAKQDADTCGWRYRQVARRRVSGNEVLTGERRPDSRVEKHPPAREQPSNTRAVRLLQIQAEVVVAHE